MKCVSSLQSLDMVFQLAGIWCFFRAEPVQTVVLFDKQRAKQTEQHSAMNSSMAFSALKIPRDVCRDALRICVLVCFQHPSEISRVSWNPESGWCSWSGIWDAYFEVQQFGALLQVFFCRFASDFPNSTPLPHKLHNLFTEWFFCELLRELLHSSIKLYSYFYLN